MFDAIGAVEPVAGLSALSPNMMFIAQSGEGITVPFPELFWQHASAVDVGEGWTWVERFGLVHEAQSPVHYHVEHGYQYSVSADGGSVWYYNYNSAEWYWTKLDGEPLYPVLWPTEGDGEWLCYQIGSNNPRLSWNYSEEA